jgi:prepilin peptidase CpaA
MFALLVFLFCVCVAVSMLYASAVSDFKRFTIPNEYPLALIVLFVVAFIAVTFLKPDLSVFFSFSSHFVAFVVVLLITAALYAFKLLGAGDSKLMAAVGLWLGIGGLVPFLFYMSVGGGLLAAATLYLKKKPFVTTPPEGSWLDTSQKGENRLPYGMAIAFGAVMAFLFNGYLNPTLWVEFVR